jgi:hypothetical protein
MRVVIQVVVGGVEAEDEAGEKTKPRGKPITRERAYRLAFLYTAARLLLQSGKNAHAAGDFFPSWGN